MGKITIMQGLPASGKSTKAKELVRLSGNSVRLNRDLLRKMLHFDKWTGLNEKFTIAAQETLATFFLANNKNVIIDDTNLNPNVLTKWKEFAKGFNVKVEVASFVDTPMYECVKRDMVRQKSVGFWTIINMARQHHLYPRTKKDIICDIDGTLCDITQRLHFVKGENKDWKSFFENLSKDEPRIEIINRIKAYAKEYNIVLVSGRPENYRQETLKWLSKYEVPYETIIMRKTGDHRDDTIVKEEILNTYLDKDKIELVIDDRPRVIRMWQEKGLKVDDVGNGMEF